MGILSYLLTGKVSGKVPNNTTIEVAKDIAKEGMVLLKNENVLPLQTKNVAVFGAGAIDTFYCGTGSGYVFSPYIINVWDGLINNGINITSSLWKKNYLKNKKISEKNSSKISFFSKRWSGLQYIYYENEIYQEEIDTSKKVDNQSIVDTAIYVIHRNAGEGGDRSATKGDYYLLDSEKKNIEIIARNFKNLIVVLNTCVIDAEELNNNPNVKAIVLMGQAGIEGGNALAELLMGKASFSGRLTDTWAKKYEDYPASKTFSSNDNNTLQEDYLEGIYVGYRYFDSFNKEVTYPFGYGLSYTTFDYQNINVSLNKDIVNISLDVLNKGNFASKEVIQIYVSQPNGKLTKAYQVLAAYKKTSLIKPEEKENISISFSLTDCASFDEKIDSYVLEEGNYLIRLGNNSRNTSIVACVILDNTVITKKVSNVLNPDKEIKILKHENFNFEKFTGKTLYFSSKDINTIDEVSKDTHKIITYLPEGKKYEIAKKSARIHFLNILMLGNRQFNA